MKEIGKGLKNISAWKRRRTGSQPPLVERGERENFFRRGQK